MGEWFHQQIFLGCYVCYYLHYKLNIRMLLKFNYLLVINLITCQLNIYGIFNRLT